MRTEVFITAQFPALHRYADAPDEVAYLRNIHRHLFHVKVIFSVESQNRECEFFIEQLRLARLIEDLRENEDALEWSCEHWAVAILAALNASGHAASSVTVSEDGENGATVHI